MRHKHGRTTAVARSLAAWGAQAAGKGSHWEYTGHNGGPQQLAGLDTALEACAKSKRQCPTHPTHQQSRYQGIHVRRSS